jgi:pimeloyl-ACP methyl ester carboxylesterase
MRQVLSVLLSLIVLGAFAYAGLCALLYFTQERSIYFPVANDPQLRRAFASSRVEIPTATGVAIEGWWLENPDVANDVVILYFGGNAEDVLYTAAEAQKYAARRMLVTNYPGYGRSKGRPGQTELYAAGVAAYRYALGKGARPGQIVVMGRSLGSGVASMLAGTGPVRSAILVTPFGSLVAVAYHHYPYLPVRRLLRHPFPSEDWARNAHAPALMIAAERDVIIPPEHAERLAERWAGTARVQVLRNSGHNDVERHPDYLRLINAFLVDPERTVQ